MNSFARYYKKDSRPVASGSEPRQLKKKGRSTGYRRRVGLANSHEAARPSSFPRFTDLYDNFSEEILLLAKTEGSTVLDSWGNKCPVLESNQ